MRLRLALTGLLPLAPILQYVLGAPAIWVFVAGVLGIAVTADWIRIATERLAAHTGSAVGSLMTISLGSLAELILALFVLARGQIEVVHAQITGSIMGTCLLGLGLATVAGGLGRERQSFRAERATLLTGLLVVVVIALLMPAVFDYADAASNGSDRVAIDDERLSLVVAVILLAIYAANLVYTLVTHRDVFGAVDEEDGRTSWSVALCLAVLAGATAAAAFESELVSRALTDTASSLGLKPLFLGVVVLALVGTSSDIFAAVWFARQDRTGLVMSICIGSAIQVALVVAPVLVIVSWGLSLRGHGPPMTLVFTNPVDLFAIIGTVLITRTVAGDGETTWFEGVLLIGVYAILAAGYAFL